MTTAETPFAPLTIGGLALRNPLIAAPMAGLSSLPYRLLAIEQGCALAISEMVSAEGTLRAHARTRRYFTNDDRARPFGVQLFGADPEAIARAVEALEEEPVDLIDINMGCPVKKVCSKGAGAALMRTPRRAEAVIAAARKTTKPLTVKIRSGWAGDAINCVEIARIAEGAGAEAVVVHGRTRMQEFRGKADWCHIAAVKDAVRIPVIGNGDVRNREDALRMFEETGCDGIMIGRAAVGNPWIFRQILEGAPSPSRPERGRTALRHFEMLRELLGNHVAMLTMRQVLPWYGRGIIGVRTFLRSVHTARTPDELRRIISDFFNWRHESVNITEPPAIRSFMRRLPGI